MNKFKNIIILLMILLVTANISFAAKTNNDKDSFTLSELKKMALENNPTLKMIQLEKDKTAIEFTHYKHTWREDVLSEQLASIQRKYYTSKKSILANVEMKYFEILTLEKQVEIQKGNLKKIKEIYENEKIKKENGLSTQVIIDGVKVNIEYAKLNIDRLEESLRRAKMELNQLVGREITSTLNIENDIEFEIINIDLENEIEFALSNSNIVKDKKLELQRIEEQYNDLTSVFRDDLWKVKETKLDIEIKEIELKKLKEDLIINMQSAYNGIQLAIRQMEITEKDLDLSNKNLEIAKVQEKLGLITNVDVTEKINDVSVKEKAYLDAKLEYRKALIRFALAKEGL